MAVVYLQPFCQQYVDMSIVLFFKWDISFVLEIWSLIQNEKLETDVNTHPLGNEVPTNNGPTKGGLKMPVNICLVSNLDLAVAVSENALYLLRSLNPLSSSAIRNSSFMLWWQM